MNQGDDDAGLSGQLLDGDLLSSADELRTLPIVRVLIGVLLRELMAWTVTLFATLVLPLFITVDNGFGEPCLVLMVAGIVIFSACYGLMVEVRRYKAPPTLRFMIVLHASIAVLTVCTAILIHAMAALSFVLMIWAGTLVILLKLVQTPTRVDPPLQLVFLAVAMSLLICFVCVAQELTAKDLIVNLVALVLNGLFLAFRYDWLANHALCSDSTYHINDIDQAWLDLYTWTADRRLVAPCRMPPPSSSSIDQPYANEDL